MPIIFSSLDLTNTVKLFRFYYLFIWGLINDTLSSSDYIVLNGVITEHWIGKDMERSDHGLI
jgi:hypothetical protein